MSAEPGRVLRVKSTLQAVWLQTVTAWKRAEKWKYHHHEERVYLYPEGEYAEKEMRSKSKALLWPLIPARKEATRPLASSVITAATYTPEEENRCEALSAMHATRERIIIIHNRSASGFFFSVHCVQAVTPMRGCSCLEMG